MRLSYRILLVIPSLLFVLTMTAQTKREMNTVEIQGDIHIDGKLNEAQWMAAEMTTDFTQLEPISGDKPSFKTEVRVLYDQNALYVGMEMLDDAPDSILHQLTERDGIGNSSWGGVVIGGFQDGINAFEYFVTVEGVQFDASITTFGEDRSWNAVWSSATQITDKGWTIEMRIPYSAMRFPENDVQQWDINFIRNIRRKREKNFWNPVDPELNGFVNQLGVINGIKNIKPPTRLFFYPYAGLTYNVEKFGNMSSDGTVYSAGMDLKYGLNNSFTLDATLIPDFSQVRNDDNVLNLSAFEVRFNENRPFFTEGTELFSKGDLFYSRRVGGTPINNWKAYDLEEGEKIVSNPQNDRLLNALKLSGRNKNGLGIGVFNAVTSETIAVVEDSIGNQRDIQTAPLTNYNVMVLDKNLKNNSYVTLINTNVLRNGSTYDANVTGLVFEINDKENKYQMSGGLGYSNKFNFEEVDEKDGMIFNLELADVKGKFNYGLEYLRISPNFDSNDLGFLNNANEESTSFWINYNEYEPTKYFRKYWINSSVEYNTLATNNTYTSFEYFVGGGVSNKRFHAMGGGIDTSPLGEDDYYETRNIERFFHFPAYLDSWIWFSSDYRKKFALDFNLNRTWYDEKGWNERGISIGPRFRVNDHLLISYRFNYSISNDERGYADTVEEDIIFSRRNVGTTVNILSGQYVFNNKMGLTFRARHYWGTVEVEDFFRLQEDGSLTDTDFVGFNEDGSSHYNRNFNAITSDVGWRWVFSPGSELSLVWKGNLFNFTNDIPDGFSNNFNEALDSPSINSFSIRLLYFIDYLALKRSKSS